MAPSLREVTSTANDDGVGDEKEISLLICSSNIGNAEPTIESMESWIPRNGLCSSVNPLLYDVEGNMYDSKRSDEVGDKLHNNSTDGKFDIIVIGMQEATWSKKKSSAEQSSLHNNSELSRTNSDDDGDLSVDDDHDNADNVVNDTSTRSTRSTRSSSNNKGSNAVRHLTDSVVGTAMNVKQVTADKLTQTNQDQSHDSILMKNMIQSVLGDMYIDIVKFQRGQMRLYIYVKKATKSKISDIDVKAENTGVGGVMANKGGQLASITINKTTRLTFMTAHLAAHEGKSYYNARNDNIREILRGARPGTKDHLSSNFDTSIYSHHMFICGDLNYRITLPGSKDIVSDNTTERSTVGNSSLVTSSSSHKQEHQDHVKRVLELIDEKDWMTLNEGDELQKALREKDCLSGFQTLPCYFNPTFKMLREDGYVYKNQRSPSYTDRILWKSCDGLSDNITPLAYEPCVNFITSDHKPIRGAFSIKPNINSLPGRSAEGVGESATTAEGQYNKETASVRRKSSLTIRRASSSSGRGGGPCVKILINNVSCTDLPAMDVNGLADPYVLLIWDPIELLNDNREAKVRKNKKHFTRQGRNKWPKTRYISRELNPVFDKKKDELHLITTKSASPKDFHEGAMIYITLMDYDATSADDLIGSIPVNVRKLMQLAEDGDNGLATLHIDQPLTKYGQEKGNFKCTIEIEKSDKHTGRRQSTVSTGRGGGGGGRGPWGRLRNVFRATK